MASVVIGAVTVTGIRRAVAVCDVDIGRRDRLRRDQPQIRIGHDHVAVDLVVQQAEQDVRFTQRADQRALGDDAARIGEQRHPRH